MDSAVANRTEKTAHSYFSHGKFYQQKLNLQNMQKWKVVRTKSSISFLD